MKYLSFIAVLFYLSLLFPTAGHSASSSWVDLQQANKHFSFALVASATHSNTDSTETPTNDDDPGLVCWNKFEFPVVQNSSCQATEIHFNSVQKSCYAARAPPVYLC
jgi:hypothetical protein